MSAPAPATDRELALEELRLALHRMLGAHRRLRSRDVRLLGGVSFSITGCSERCGAKES